MVADATFNGASSCLVNSSAQPCTVTTNSEKTIVRIASNSSFNLYPQSQTTTIQIDQLKFNYASSHSSYIYHFYFQEGTVYLKTSTVNSNTLVYSHPDSQTIQVSGFSGTIPSGSLLTVTFSAWIGASPIFNIYVSIDTAAHITASAPIIYGTTSATVSGLPENFISALTGSGGETNKLTAMQTTTSSISFSVTPLFTTYAGSFL